MIERIPQGFRLQISVRGETDVKAEMILSLEEGQALGRFLLLLDDDWRPDAKNTSLPDR
jgi:hypothetical protein